jgi:hypothetical protein
MKALLISGVAALGLILAPAAYADDEGGTYAPSRDCPSEEAPSFYHHTPKPDGGATLCGAVDADMHAPGVVDEDAYSPGVLGGSQGTGYTTRSWFPQPQTRNRADGTPGD